MSPFRGAAYLNGLVYLEKEVGDLVVWNPLTDQREQVFDDHLRLAPAWGFGAGGWVWDLTEIEGQTMTENVAELLAGKVAYAVTMFAAMSPVAQRPVRNSSPLRSELNS